MQLCSSTAELRSRFDAVARLDTPVDVVYHRNGGILQTVLRSLLKG